VAPPYLRVTQPLLLYAIGNGHNLTIRVR
jgi:hypothetical protein